MSNKDYKEVVIDNDAIVNTEPKELPEEAHNIPQGVKPELNPNPGYGEDGETKPAIKTDLVEGERGTPVDVVTPAQESFKSVTEIYNFLNGLKIKGKNIEDYIDDKGGVTEEELRAALLEYTKKSEVAAQLIGKDISVEGITSKGIANTGNIANIGDIATTGNVSINGIVEVLQYELDEDITISNLPIGINSYYAHARISNNKLNVVIALVTGTGETTPATPRAVLIGSLNLPDSVLAKLHPYYQVYLASKVGKFTTSNNIIDTDAILQIRKETGKIDIYLCNKKEFITSTFSDCRFEFNFILS